MIKLSCHNQDGVKVGDKAENETGSLLIQGGLVGGVEEWRIKPSPLSTKLKLSLAILLEM